MKLKTKSNRSCKALRVIVLVIASLAIIAGSLAILENLHIIDILPDKSPASTQLDNRGAPTQEQIEAGKQIKQNSSDKPVADFSATILSIITDGEYIRIRALINGVISNTGTCQIILTKSSQENSSITKMVNMYAMPSYSTCQGFDINKSELGSGGWNAQLKVVVDGKSTTTEKGFRIE